jgi:predicted enzyme related to lactoylglutathione lyase
MTERDGYQAGVPCWVDTAQPDPDAAIRFYGGLFGWEFEGPAPMAGPGGAGDDPGRYYVARLRGRDVAGVSSQPSEGAPPVPVWNTYISVDSADDTARRVADAGGSVLVAPFDVAPAGRMAVLADQQGAALCAWEPRDRRGAQLVNESGAWSMSALNARDTEGAKTFYGEVFGWTTQGFPVGDMEATLWRLPGYVGGQPEQPVPRDNVATMAPMTSDNFPDDVPSHWAVDFWVGNVDEAAEKAAELGGSVLAPPYDLPIEGQFRQAVIADPQGAAFSVSRVGPPE